MFVSTFTNQNRKFVYGCVETYRYTFNGKEEDRETVSTSGGTQDYGMRIYNPSLGRFLSVDPLTSGYPSWSPYPYAMNRPIDGVDLDGGEWKSENKWSDKISDNSHIEYLQKNGIYTQDMTYADLWRVFAPAILCKVEQGNEKMDCADACIYTLVKFAYQFKLPVNFKDNKSGAPTIDNDEVLKDRGFFLKGTKDKVRIKKDDWEKLAEKIGAYYGAEDLFSNSSLTREIGEVNENSADDVLNNIRPGDLVIWDHLEGGQSGHAVTVTDVPAPNPQGKIEGFGTIQGQPDQIPAYDFKEGESLIDRVKNGTDKIKGKSWNFNEFDKEK